MLGTRFFGQVVLICSFAAATAVAAPQLVLFDGDVFTADPAKPRAQALAVEDGRITAVGSDAEVRALAGPGTRMVDAGGRLVTPGLIESHAQVGWDLPGLLLPMPGDRLRGPGTDEVLAAVKQAASHRHDWVSAWIGAVAARERRNWRTALDEAAPRTPVLLRGFWGHTTIINSEAMRRLGIRENVADPPGGWWGRDDKGRLDGRVYEAAEAIEQRIAAPSARRLAPAFAAAATRYAQWGVTSIHQMDTPVPASIAIETLRHASPPQRWTLYGSSSVGGGIERSLSETWRIAGTARVLDGMAFEQNAHRRDPYPGRAPWSGRSNYGDAQLQAILRSALDNAGQLSLQVNGDGETERLLDAMRQLAPAAVWQGKRLRVEHGSGIRADLIDRVHEMGLVVVLNPTRLPPALADGSSPAPVSRLPRMRSLDRAGIPLAIGSDAREDEANPFLNMMLACTYPASRDESLSREQALVAYTAGAAFAERAENIKGRIAPGFVADVAVLSQNVLTVPDSALAQTVSVFTLVNGVVVHDRLSH